MCSSTRSTSSAKAKAAAKKAALEAQAETLRRLHQLEIEELVLKQRKQQL
jgi:aminoglycoside phosphotransferase